MIIPQRKQASGFSLMEMMIVLLIVAIIAAATAPMVAKKMSRDAGSADSPWLFTGTSNNITFLGEKVLVGATAAPATDTSRLFIAGGNRPHIGFGSSNGTVSYLVFDTGDDTGANSKIGMTNVTSVPNNSVMFGGGQTVANGIVGIVAIGKGTTSNASSSIAIGRDTRADGSCSIAIGREVNKDYETVSESNKSAENSIIIGKNALAYKQDSVVIGPNAQARYGGIYLGGSEYAGYGSCVAIGNGAHAYDYSNIAIGTGASTLFKSSGESYSSTDSSDYAIAIGHGATAKSNNSVAIGHNATADQVNQIVLGTADSTVYIPGKLVVSNLAVIGDGIYYYSTIDNKIEFIDERKSVDRGEAGSGQTDCAHVTMYNSNSSLPNWFRQYVTQTLSDRRLKNVGKEYTAGLEELKKLEFFHYTFKKDKNKTPHVGVMAQDLQKVFPDAVTEGNDGYLRIRWDEMFYAVINAVKELDKKFCAVVEDITGMKATIKAQQAHIEDLEKRIEKLEALVNEK